LNRSWNLKNAQFIFTSCLSPVSDIRPEGGEAIALGANVAKEDEVLAMFSQMYQHFGTIDILVNNAGLQKDSAFVDMMLE